MKLGNDYFWLYVIHRNVERQTEIKGRRFDNEKPVFMGLRLLRFCQAVWLAVLLKTTCPQVGAWRGAARWL